MNAPKVTEVARGSAHAYARQREMVMASLLAVPTRAGNDRAGNPTRDGRAMRVGGLR